MIAVEKRPAVPNGRDAPDSYRAGQMKRSSQIRLVLSGAVATALWTTGCNRDESVADTAANVPPFVSTNQVYTNNHFVSGAGYYHAPYGGWYARPFNSYLPGRGYYHGGDWWSTPYSGPIMVSTPRANAVESANLKTEPLRARSGGFSSSGGSSSSSSSRSGGSTHSGSSISRGGFGGSHSSSSS